MRYAIVGPTTRVSGGRLTDVWGLGHRRLAIIDLSLAGHQPLFDSTAEMGIVFNGREYNVPT